MQTDRAGHFIPNRPRNGSEARISPDDFLSGLRREFPDWGILRGTLLAPWVAVRGERLEILAVDGITLRQRLQAASGHGWGR